MKDFLSIFQNTWLVAAKNNLDMNWVLAVSGPRSHLRSGQAYHKNSAAHSIFINYSRPWHWTNWFRFEWNANDNVPFNSMPFHCFPSSPSAFLMLLLMLLMFVVLLATVCDSAICERYITGDVGVREQGVSARYMCAHTHLSGSGVFNFYDCINGPERLPELSVIC